MVVHGCQVEDVIVFVGQFVQKNLFSFALRPDIKKQLYYLFVALLAGMVENGPPVCVLLVDLGPTEDQHANWIYVSADFE